MKPKVRLPKHVTIVDGGYQVRIVREGKEYSRWFAWSKGISTAIAEAIQWRNKMLTQLGPAMLLKKNLSPSKKSQLPVGVCAYVKKSRSGKWNLCFQVSFSDEGRRKVKSFNAPQLEYMTAADERHARKTAEAFRAEFEHCYRNGLKFEQGKYSNWRESNFYTESAAVKHVGDLEDK